MQFIAFYGTILAISFYLKEGGMRKFALQIFESIRYIRPGYPFSTRQPKGELPKKGVLLQAAEPPSIRGREFKVTGTSVDGDGTQYVELILQPSVT